MAISEKLVDKRIVTRNLHRGTLDEKAYQEYLAGLPDRQDLAEPLNSGASVAAGEEGRPETERDTEGTDASGEGSPGA